MSRYYILLFGLFLTVITQVTNSSAATIKGKVYELKSKIAMSDVEIINIHTDRGLNTDSTGLFNINVNAGDLIEFRKLGYKTARIRIPKGQLPSFYNIALEEGYYELEEAIILGNVSIHQKDSLRNAKVFQRAIEFYKLEGIDLVQHPFDALSKRSREIWAFQKMYDYWEKEKFIDYVFSDKLITELTQLASDSLSTFKRQYRPSYYMIKTWNDYDYYQYIKFAAAEFRRQKTHKGNDIYIQYQD